MKRKNFFALLLCVILVFAGCGKSQNTSSDANDAEKKTETVETEVTATAKTEGTAIEENSSVLKDGKMTELLVVVPGDNAAPSSLAEVENAINDIISETIDAKVKFQIQEWGTYADQTNLMLSSGEKMDVYFTVNGSKDYANKGQLTPITDIIDTCAKETKDLMGEYIDACYVNGELYGFPTWNSYAIQGGLVCRNDILKEAGYEVSDVRNWDDVEKVLEKVKELYPNMYPLVSANVQQGILYFGTLGTFDDIQSGVGVYMNDTDEVKVINTYDTDEYRELAKRAYDWNQKGLFIPDATTVTETRQDLFKAGSAFGYIGKISPTVATQESMSTGFDMVSIPITDSIITTQRLNFAQWTIPAACESPEKAVAFLNYLYTDPRVQNLYHYGIEGKDYEIKDAEKGIVGYPDGVTSNNVGWSTQLWTSGNASIGYLWETDIKTLFTDVEAFNKTATFSPLYGFVYDSQNVRTEITAVQNVLDKYSSVITSGLSEPDTAVDKFIEELNAAGINNIVEDMQAQVDSWRENR